MKNPAYREWRGEPTELRLCSLHFLAEPEAVCKAQGVSELARLSDQIELDVTAKIIPQQLLPGRPNRPELVAPRLLKHRSMATPEGRAILIHALAHIEFNAINLALDAIWRFPDMPRAYYTDWLKVAGEEALHFSLLTNHLQNLGYQYGDFPAHNSLWEMAEKTRHDILARMALVPRTMEARGLDATPQLRDKLAQAGDGAAAKILETILHDEVGHVLIGNRWYAYLCEQRGEEPIATYRQLTTQYAAPILRGPLNVLARKAAGFSEVELAALIDQ